MVIAILEKVGAVRKAAVLKILKSYKSVHLGEDALGILPDVSVTELRAAISRTIKDDDLIWLFTAGGPYSMVGTHSISGSVSSPGR